MAKTVLRMFAPRKLHTTPLHIETSVERSTKMRRGEERRGEERGGEERRGEGRRGGLS
jgi:hypothetical protein